MSAGALVATGALCGGILGYVIGVWERHRCRRFMSQHMDDQPEEWFV